MAPRATFGEFVLDPGARQLTRAGIPLHLTRKALQRWSAEVAALGSSRPEVGAATAYLITSSR